MKWDYAFVKSYEHAARSVKRQVTGWWSTAGHLGHPGHVGGRDRWAATYPSTGGAGATVTWLWNYGFCEVWALKTYTNFQTSHLFVPQEYLHILKRILRIQCEFDS